MAEARHSVVLHASAVAFGNQGILIQGAPGSGKSTLALQLIGIGAKLVADDLTLIEVVPGGGLRMTAPPQISGQIEARGMGVLKVEPVVAYARAVVDLDVVETERVPHAKETVIAGEPLRVFSKAESPAFATMLRIELAGY